MVVADGGSEVCLYLCVGYLHDVSAEQVVLQARRGAAFEHVEEQPRPADPLRRHTRVAVAEAVRPHDRRPVGEVDRGPAQHRAVGVVRVGQAHRRAVPSQQRVGLGVEPRRVAELERDGR